MQQRQLRLGDILDDYCPRERRVTNHVIVAMIDDDVKQVRCTTCDADHDFKHAKVPRQRRKTETPAALYAQVLASGPKRVTHEGPAVGTLSTDGDAATTEAAESTESVLEAVTAAAEPGRLEDSHAADADVDADDPDEDRVEEEGPVHRPLIRASLPKIDGAPPPTRQIPEFTIRQPAGRPTNRFRPRHQRGGAPGGGGQQFQGNRSHSGGGNMPGQSRGGMRSNGGGRPPQGQGAQARRHGPGRKRSK
jgi:hypothetical protein